MFPSVSLWGALSNPRLANQVAFCSRETSRSFSMETGQVKALLGGCEEEGKEGQCWGQVRRELAGEGPRSTKVWGLVPWVLTKALLCVHFPCMNEAKVQPPNVKVRGKKDMVVIPNLCGLNTRFSVFSSPWRGW